MPRTGLPAEEVKNRALELTTRRIREEGYENLRLIDIAKDLGVSHVALYSHFADKSALLDGVSERWLADVDAHLERICQGGEPVLERIQAYFLTLHRAKRDRVRRDPELYKAFNMSVEENKPFVRRHLASVDRQVLALAEEAVAQRKIVAVSATEARAILLEVTYGFTEPKLVQQHLSEDREALLGEVLRVVLCGLGAKRSKHQATIRRGRGRRRA